MSGLATSFPRSISFLSDGRSASFSFFFVFVGSRCSLFRDLSPFIFLASVHFFVGLSCAVGFMTFLSFFLTLDHFFHPTFMSCLFYDFSFKIYININGVSPVFLICIKNNIFILYILLMQFN